MNQSQELVLNEVLKSKNFKYMVNVFPPYKFISQKQAQSIFDGVKDHIDSLGEDVFNDKNSIECAVQKYFFDNQPQLSEKNYDKMVEVVIGRCQPKISALARKLVNANGDYEDYVSELQIAIIQMFRKYQEGFLRDTHKGWKDWLYCALRIVHNRYADLCHDFSKKTDTSLFIDRFDTEGSNKLMYDAQDGDEQLNAQPVESAEDTVITNELYSKLLEYLAKEENGSEIVSFLQESVNPSDHTWEVYENWLKESGNRNPFKNSVKIPFKIICKSLQIDYNKISRYKEIIGITLVKLGVNHGDVFPKYKSMNRNFWLSRGCPAPSIKYNEDGSSAEVIDITTNQKVIDVDEITVAA